MTKTFLIIDGQGFLFNPLEMEEAFADAGIKADFQVTDYKPHALDIIREWKERGLKLDVISCDINATRDNSGIVLLESILDDVAKEIGNDMLPQKLFLHSADWDREPIVTKYGTSPCVIDDGELSELGNEQGVYNGDMAHHIRGRELRDYLNANWGTRFVMSEAEEKNLKNPNGPLDPNDIISLLYNNSIKPEQALQRIKLHNADAFIDRPYVIKPEGGFDKEPCELSFSRGVTGTVAGSAAYNAEDITQVKAQSPQEPVMLILNNAANYEVPPQGIDALIVLEDDVHAAHIKQVCENMGVPALIGANREDEWNDYKFSVEEGLSFSQYGGSKQSGFIKAGSGLTLQAHSDGGRLWAEKFPLEYGEDYITGNFRKVINAADFELKKSDIHIRANADTATQVQEAIEMGADGIGLVRTEHMFFEPEKKNVLREILLTSVTPPP